MRRLDLIAFVFVFGFMALAAVGAKAQTGQPPQPGLAVFDVIVTRPTGVTSAVNFAGLPVTSSAPGPYYVNAATPSALGTRPTVTMSWTGLPNSPVICLIGPASTGIATYPGVGQLDIGSLPLIGGLPGSLFLVGDGTNLSTNFLNYLFVTNTTGTGSLTFVAPPLPPGIIRFQYVANPSGLFFMSNAVDVMF